MTGTEDRRKITIRALLQQCRDEMLEIKILEERRQELIASLLPHSLEIQQVKVQTSASEDKISEIEAKAADLQAEIDRQLAILLNKQHRAHQVVSRIENPKYRQMLTLYYLSFRTATRETVYPSGKIKQTTVKTLYTWEAVAEKINYSIQHTYEMLDDMQPTLSKKIRVNQSAPL